MRKFHFNSLCVNDTLEDDPGGSSQSDSVSGGQPNQPADPSLESMPWARPWSFILPICSEEP